MNNKKSIVIIIAVVYTLVCSTAIISCTHSSSNSPVSFSSDVQPILTSSCAINSSCHMGANGTNQYTNFDADSAYYTLFKKELVNTTTPQASLLYAEVEEGQMPLSPYPKLSAAQQNTILTWIQQGARNN